MRKSSPYKKLNKVGGKPTNIGHKKVHWVSNKKMNLKRLMVKKL